jgi:hypothetical protein
VFEKTLSEKIARVFEIVSYLMLIPTFLILIFLFVMFFLSLANFSILGFLCLIPITFAGLGIYLLVGYFKHSRGRLDGEKIFLLWGSTFLYNLIICVPGIYFYYCEFFRNPIYYGRGPGSTPFIFFTAIVGWWVIAMILSASAAISELFANQK